MLRGKVGVEREGCGKVGVEREGCGKVGVEREGRFIEGR